MTQTVEKALATMLSVYRENDILLTRGILKPFTQIAPVACVRWVWSLTYSKTLSTIPSTDILARQTIPLIQAAIESPNSVSLEDIYTLTWKNWHNRYAIWNGPKPYLALAGLGWACQGLLIHANLQGEGQWENIRKTYGFEDIAPANSQRRIEGLIGDGCNRALIAFYDHDVEERGHMIVAESYRRAIAPHLPEASPI